MENRGNQLSRRALLLGGSLIGAGLLAGCSTPKAAVVPKLTSQAPTPTAAPTPTQTPTPTPTPTPEPVETEPKVTPEPSPEAPADVEAVIAAHEGQWPNEWGLHFSPIVNTGYDAGSAQPDRVFLTLDACGGSAGVGYDWAMIDGLRERGVPATLCLNQRWIEANWDIAVELAADELFELANHGTQHKPLSVTGESAYGIPGTTSVREAAYEVWDNHQTLTDLVGRPPRFFRSGTAHYDDVAVSIAQDLGERVLGFSINGDGGATIPAGQIADIGWSVGAGDIVIGHMNQPNSVSSGGILPLVDNAIANGLEFGHL